MHYVCSLEDVNVSTASASNMPAKSVESKQSEASSLVFTPNVIIHISSNSALSRADLKVNQIQNTVVIPI